MSTEKVEINGRVYAKIIEVKPVTLICHNGDAKITYKNRFPISDQETIYHITRCKLLHPRTLELYHVVFPNLLSGYLQGFRVNPSGDENTEFVSTNGEHIIFKDWIHMEGTGSQHVFGLIDLTLKFESVGFQVAWVHPESHLHPSAQVNLADLAILLTKTDEQLQAEKIKEIKKDIGYQP